MQPPSDIAHWTATLPASVVVIAVLILGLALGLFLAKWRVQRRMNTNRRTGRLGEETALALLERAGFELVSTQPQSTIKVEVDGYVETYRVRPDAIVAKHGRQFLVEIKGTRASAEVRNRQTRRQMLEYATAFDVHECLLVNAAEETIQVIRFPALADD